MLQGKTNRQNAGQSRQRNKYGWSRNRVEENKMHAAGFVDIFIFWVLCVVQVESCATGRSFVQGSPAVCVYHCVIKCSYNKHPALTVRKVEEVRIKKLICRISWQRFRPYCDHPQVIEHIKTVQSNLSFGLRTYAYELPLILTVLFFWLWGFCTVWYWQGRTKRLGEKPAPVPLCTSQFPRVPTWVWTIASTVVGRRLT